MHDISPQKFKIHHYHLKSELSLNSLRTRRGIDGLLLEIDGGYACLQPWKELGDPSLEKCLADLMSPNPKWPIVRRALRCAAYDRVARQFGHSLFEDMEVPLSHFTQVSLDLAESKRAAKLGFTHIKLKCGRDLYQEQNFINQAHVALPQLKWRLDFNESLEPNEFLQFISQLSPACLSAIDFIEDPTPYSPSQWKLLHEQIKLALAIDRETLPNSTSAQVIVVKPALDEPQILAESAEKHRQRLVLTSYMDHPIGQTFAAWEAARMNLMFPDTIDLCGLQTHHLFEKNDFSDMLGELKPEFHIPDGLGLGFDDLLKNLSWKSIS